ncbi:hypothetical protein M6B38_327375 [Iris pallida]|uniref:Uncharacterized protein n=1 Tax=Iris pallida TaxID=29817 RepID=A0AAX6H782_IRIPA|nr:hypothetical protein M6B38_327375 [Iris pallida]
MCCACVRNALGERGSVQGSVPVRVVSGDLTVVVQPKFVANRCWCRVVLTIELA